MFNFTRKFTLLEDDSNEDEEHENSVTLLTVHASKGLEYRTVFVIGCEEQLFPHWRSMQSTTELEEERRLMYVAMTRAERYLYLTSANYRRGQYNPTSRFLTEIETYLQQ